MPPTPKKKETNKRTPKRICKIYLSTYTTMDEKKKKEKIITERKEKKTHN